MKYLFYIAKLYSLPIIQPLTDYLNQNRQHDYVLFCSEKVKHQIEKEDKWKNVKILSSIKECKLYQPDFCLTPGNYIDFRIPGIKVEIFHGVGIEKSSHYKIRHFFDIYLSSGPFVTRQYQKLQEKYRYFLVKETGWAKFDYIMNYPVENLKEKLGIPSDKKVILYAPTFSDKLQSADDLLPVIPRIIRPNELFLLKFHELKNERFIEQIIAETGNQIMIINSHDITPYLHVSDVMISDTSSVLYEFMALDKPVITYKTRSRKDKGIDITHPDELRPALDRCLKNPKEFSNLRKQHLNEVNPRLDGSIAKTIFDTLDAVVKNNELSKKKKPLNLFRKVKILYHELFRKGYIR